MTLMRKWVRAALVLGALSMAGCSLLTEPWKREAAPPVAAAKPAPAAPTGRRYYRCR